MPITFTKISFSNHFFKSLFFYTIINMINFKSLIFILQPIFSHLLYLNNNTLNYRISKNPRKQLRKIKKFKNSFKINYFTGVAKLKFSNFFYLNEKRSPLIASKFLQLPYPNKKLTSKFFNTLVLIPNNFFWLYKRFFKQRWFPLTGFAISRLAFSLRDRKQWIIKNLKIRIRRNYKYYKFSRTRNILRLKSRKISKKGNLISKRLKKKCLKTVYYNNLFYFIRTRISFRRLKFFSKLIRSKSPTNAQRCVYHQSYLFLNNKETQFKTALFPLKRVYKLFKLHKKLFRVLKRRNSWTKKWAHIWFKAYSNVNRKANKQLITFGFKLNIKHILRKFFNSKLVIAQFSHCDVQSQYLVSFFANCKKKKNWHKKCMKLWWRQFFIGQPLRRLRRRITYRKFKFFLKRYLNITRKIRKNTSIFEYLTVYSHTSDKLLRRLFRRHRGEKWYDWRITRRFRKWCFWIFLNKKIFKKKSTFLNYHFYKFYRQKNNNNNNNLLILTYQIMLTAVPSLSNFFLRSLPLKIHTIHLYNFSRHTNFLMHSIPMKFLQPALIKSAVHTLLKKPMITPIHRSNFTLGLTGFLITTSTLFLNYKNKNKQQVYIIKKKMHTFAYKSDMRKHLLKKATKWRRSTTLVTYFRKRRAMRWKKFYNPVYKELKMSTQKSAITLNSPISNLRSLLSQRFCSPYSLSTTQYLKRKNFGKKHRRLKIKKVKFKASSTWWRRSRNALTQSLNLKFRYQHRLTKFIINYKKIIHTKFLPIFEMRLFNILIRTRFVLDQITALNFIDNRLIFINGVCCSNRNLQLFPNDCIQLIVNLKYYVMFRWLLNFSIRMKKRIKHFSWKNKQRKRTEGKQWSHRLQRFVLPHKHLTLDIAKYLEVDFFSLSAFILYDPFLWNDINRNNILNVKYGIINVYNWKYIT
jgi:hypothetical protein